MNSANSSPASRPSTVSGRQRAGEPLGQHLEHAVAGAVTEGVVHFLEAVHVEVQQRDAGAAAQRARDGLLQQMLELHAVRNLGERVVAGEVADAALGALAVGDVARHEDAARELRVVGVDVRAGERHRNGLAAVRAQHRFADFAGALQRHVRIGVGRALAAATRCGDRPARSSVAPVSRLCGEVGDADRAVGRGHEHRVGHAVEHVVEVVLRDGGLARLWRIWSTVRCRSPSSSRRIAARLAACSRPGVMRDGAAIQRVERLDEPAAIRKASQALPMMAPWRR